MSLSAQLKPPIKAVIFDLDDTLWPLIPLIFDAEQALYDWLQVHTPKVTARFSLSDMRQIRHELVPTNPRFSYDLWALRSAVLTHAFTEVGENVAQVEAAMQVFEAARSSVAMYPDVLPSLAQLQERFVLGSISNGFANLQQIGLASIFKVSLAAHQFGCAKPDPRLFLAACKALDVQPIEALYVGDDLWLDVQGAQQAGLQAGWMNRSNKECTAEIVPEVICRDLYDLCTHLIE